MTHDEDERRVTQLDRIELKLDALLAAICEDEEDEPEETLDGGRVPGERNQLDKL